MARGNNSSKSNIKKYRKPLNLNLGMIIFGFIFVYIIIMIILYFTASHITGYEVRSGSLAIDNTYRGVALREESLYQADDSGYINYYARECERVAKGKMVYTIDESGKLNDLLRANAQSGDNLKNEDLSELRTQIMNYKSSYSDLNFDEVYNFKFSVNGTVKKLANQNVLSSLSQIKDQSVLDLIKFGYASQSGIVVYSVDGLENLKTSDITQDTFVEDDHKKTQLQSNILVSNGDSSYKMITSENWSVVIPIDENRKTELEDETYIQVKFLKTGDVSWASVNLFQNEGNDYCQLSFTNSMITYASDRYLDVELLLNAEEGLKIPNSSIVEKEFYLIPHNYLIKGGDTSEDGFMRETYLEDGSVSTEFIPADIYYSTDDEYYVDTLSFRLGDYIVPADSGDKYPISKKGTLIGVYNMNKGYADFTQVTILYQNKEYAIVKSNTDYGLNIYDHIVLNGNSVNDDDFVYD